MGMRSIAGIAGLILVGASFLTAAPVRAADAQAATVESATYLLQRATSGQDSSSYMMLLALRQLHDPALAPLFTALTRSDNPGLEVHGFLGMADCAAKPALDLAYLATVKDARLQAEMISAAMDNDLLTLDQAQQAISWPDLDMTVRLLVATRLLQKHQFKDLDLLHKAVASDNLGRQALGALMLTQLGQPEGPGLLAKINQSKDPRRDQVCDMALNVISKFEFAKCAPWALAVVTDKGTSTRTSLAGLQVALRFKVPGAEALFHREILSTTDGAQRIRLALVALGLSPWMDAAFYQPLTASADPLIHQMGLAGAAVAAKQDIAANVIALVRIQHPLATDWALHYARQDAPLPDAVRIFEAVVQNYSGPQRNRAQRLDDVVAATQMMMDRDAAQSAPYLKAILAGAPADPLWLQAILLGLMRAKGSAALSALPDKFGSEDPDVRRLGVLLLARHGRPLTASQLDDLSLLVRGGSDLPDFLRVQAAWIYLKRIDRNQAVLAKLIGG